MNINYINIRFILYKTHTINYALTSLSAILNLTLSFIITARP